MSHFNIPSKLLENVVHGVSKEDICAKDGCKHSIGATWHMRDSSFYDTISDVSCLVRIFSSEIYRQEKNRNEYTNKTQPVAHLNQSNETNSIHATLFHQLIIRNSRVDFPHPRKEAVTLVREICLDIFGVASHAVHSGVSTTEPSKDNDNDYQSSSIDQHGIAENLGIFQISIAVFFILQFSEPPMRFVMGESRGVNACVHVLPNLH
mmetsp:Transcript_3861/g.8234  ORF Transcript_3861/g.8234 Transcript_3861/m.8234 type:complete len:207 (+) Transcript_3861:2298-2918(+)